MTSYECAAEHRGDLQKNLAVWLAAFEAGNERVRAIRRRYRATEVRAEYARRIADEENRPVRSYQWVEGASTEDRERERLARKAERQRAARAGASEEAKALEADRKWTARQRAKGASEAEIAAGLQARHMKRVNFGRF